MPRINYSQCWEDPELLKRALNVNAGDTILSITSGGDNALFLARALCARVIAVDQNLFQNYLAHLKESALATLSPTDAQAFLGVTPSDTRFELYKTLEAGFSKEERAFWEKAPSLIARGVMHAGKFERFLKFFRHTLLPLIHSRETITAFLSLGDLKEQQQFFHEHIDTARWRFFLGLYSHPVVSGRFARGKGMNAYQVAQVQNPYTNRFAKMCTDTPVRENFFLHYCLTGTYGEVLPPYLQSVPGAPIPLVYETNDLLTTLKSLPAQSVAGFNLSDIFEALSVEANDMVWGEIVRVARPLARVLYYNNIVTRHAPATMSEHIQDEPELARKLSAQNRVPLYGELMVHTIHP